MNISTLAAKAFAHHGVRVATTEALKAGGAALVPFVAAGLAVYGTYRIVKWLAE